MLRCLSKKTTVFFILFIMLGAGITLLADHADARSRGGGRSFGRSRSYRPPARQRAPSRNTTRNTGGSFGRGLAGGLMGGAIGSMLFGGMARGGMGGGLGGSGIGLFQILIMAGIGYFIYTRFFKRRPDSYQDTHQKQGNSFYEGDLNSRAEPPPDFGTDNADNSVESGFAMIRENDRSFNPDHFKEVASDVFFQVQAGWMRRDVESYRHLLGEQLAREYEQTFAEMKQKGQINKLESIAVRKIEIADAGIDGKEDFITVLFTANLLDYTVNDKTGDLIEGSMTEPVKFAEKWSWSRKIGTEYWRLEGIEVVK